MGLVVRRYVVFLCRRWYFWGDIFIVDFGRDVIFSTRCSTTLIAFSTPCHHLFLLRQPCFQIMILTKFLSRLVLTRKASPKLG